MLHLVDDAWAEAAEGWDEEPAVRRYAQEADRSLRKVLAREGVEISACDVLDFGCGTGLLTEALVPDARSITGHDISAAMLERYRAKAQRWPNVRTEPGPLPPEAAYDLIVASSVLGFVPDLEATVRELGSRLRPGGLLVQWDWEAADGYGLSREAIITAFNRAGLVICSIETGFEAEIDGQTMAPLMGVARRL